MEINPELVQRFFENKCDPAERDTVLHYLDNHPEAMEKFFPMKDWDIVNADALPEDMSKEILEHITKEIFTEQKSGHVLLFRYLSRAIAAAILLAIVSVIPLLLHERQKNSGIKKTIAIHQAVSNADSLWIKKENNTKKNLTILLPDGSAVQLEGNSFIKYQQVFGVEKREIWLKGKAFFKVSKEKGKAFTVYTQSLNTTALGTSFHISTSGRNTEVRLYTGKVVIKAVNNLPGWGKEVYLLPGEKISYNFISSQVTVVRNKISPVQTMPEQVSEGQDLVFDNASLKEVMNKLSRKYHRTISFNYSDMSCMNFTGTISGTDSLGAVLRLIANMNNLVVKEDGNTYTVSKQGR